MFRPRIFSEEKGRQRLAREVNGNQALVFTLSYKEIKQCMKKRKVPADL